MVDSAPAPVSARYGLRQYNRTVRVVIGPPGASGRSWDTLRVTWGIKRTKSKRPSPGKIQIYNLNADSRSWVERAGNAVFLYGGYGTIPDLLFKGDVDEVTVKQDGKDIVTEISARDGAVKFRDGFISATYEPPLDSAILLRRIANAMGLSIGYISSDLEVIPYNQGYTLAGPGRDALDDVCGSLGASWSIQDDELLITKLGQPTSAPAFLLHSGYDGSRNTGLIGSPEKTKKGVKVRILLNGKIKPGSKVKVESRDIRGWFGVEQANHSGDSGFSSDFYTDLTLKAV